MEPPDAPRPDRLLIMLYNRDMAHIGPVYATLPFGRGGSEGYGVGGAEMLIVLIGSEIKRCDNAPKIK